MPRSPMTNGFSDGQDQDTDAPAHLTLDTSDRLAVRVADTAALLIDVNTDPKTADLDDPTGPPDWNRSLDRYAEGILRAHDPLSKGNPVLEKVARAYVDQCFEWCFEQTPEKYAAEREAMFAPTEQPDLFQDYLWGQDFGPDSSTFDAIKRDVQGAAGKSCDLDVDI